MRPTTSTRSAASDRHFRATALRYLFADSVAAQPLRLASDRRQA
jgi:hypothetical protein